MPLIFTSNEPSNGVTVVFDIFAGSVVIFHGFDVMLRYCVDTVDAWIVEPINVELIRSKFAIVLVANIVEPINVE